MPSRRYLRYGESSPDHPPHAGLPRRAYATASACAIVVLFGASTAGADEPKIAASMSCERAAEPGRVKCSVEARAAGGASIAWADVAIIDLPEFTSALKGRIGPADATARDAASQRWAFALVARKTGEGEARARVRAVVCEARTSDASAPKCAPTTLEVRAIVHVG